MDFEFGGDLWAHLDALEIIDTFLVKLEMGSFEPLPADVIMQAAVRSNALEYLFRR